MSGPRSAPDPDAGWLAPLAALGGQPLTQELLEHHVHPLFSRVLSHSRDQIHLANHSLGRPLDRTEHDVLSALRVWYDEPRRAWHIWLAAREDFRHRIARLIGARDGDCVVPRTSAGQGLRAVLNSYQEPITVVTTRDEFDSLDFILKVYAERGRIQLRRLGPDERGRYAVETVAEQLRPDVDLVVISMVLFTTGQLLSPLKLLVDAAHACGARVLADLYHVVGVVPVDVQALDADFAVGGCYKYLRGGPGSGWLYLHPRLLEESLQTLDTGWYAQPAPFDFERPDRPSFATGGDAWLESTPAVLPFFQARAGLAFTEALGVERLRAYSLQQQAVLQRGLQQRGVAIDADPQQRGAFLCLHVPDANGTATRLLEAGVITDARGHYLRLCPDILNTDDELHIAARAIAEHIA